MFMIMFVFFVLRMSEVLRSGAITLAFKGNLDSISFWTEMILMVVGLWCVRSDEVRSKPNNIFLGSVLIMAAGSLYRINVYIIGFHPVPGVTYFPSVAELSISIGMICLQLVFFIMIVKTFPIIAKERR
jgi:Ni/Fe-hydrogenase subunit HybB-like protein